MPILASNLLINTHPYNQEHNWYINSAQFTFSEKYWNLDGDPVEVNDDGEGTYEEIYETYIYKWAKYKNGSWTYSENWDFGNITIGEFDFNTFTSNLQSSQGINIYLNKKGQVAVCFNIYPIKCSNFGIGTASNRKRYRRMAFR